MLTFLIHFGYLLMLCAFIARDILYLRSLLICAQSIVVVYTWRMGVPIVAGWNVLFVCINTYMVVQVLRERRAVVLPAELRDLYERHFSALSPQEFLRWWSRGRRETLENEQLARNGEHPDWLYFLLRGTVRVMRDERVVVDLPAGYFVAEMSLLTGKPANADVHPVGSIEVVRWATRDLREVRDRNPLLWTKIQSVIGHDLVEKIRRGERRSEVDPA
jgi:hypothetical protein